MPRAAMRQATTGTDASTGTDPATGTDPSTGTVDVGPKIDETHDSAERQPSAETVTKTDEAEAASEASESEETKTPEVDSTEVDAPVAGTTVAGATVAAGTVTEVAPPGRKRFSLRRSRGIAEPVPDREEDDTRKPDANLADSDEADSDAADSDAADSEAPEPVLVPHRTAGRVLKAVAIVAAGLFVSAVAFAGANLEPYLADRAIVHTKFEVADTAAKAITTLWTYTPDDMAQLPERSAKYLGGDFASEYRRYIDAIVAPNKQAQITNNTQVMGAAIESLTGDEASAIVYTNSVATSPVTKGAPSLRYLSYRLAMKRQGADWLITRMTALTSLDVTPRI